MSTHITQKEEKLKMCSLLPCGDLPVTYGQPKTSTTKTPAPQQTDKIANVWTNTTNQTPTQTKENKKV